MHDFFSSKWTWLENATTKYKNKKNFEAGRIILKNSENNGVKKKKKEKPQNAFGELLYGPMICRGDVAIFILGGDLIIDPNGIFLRWARSHNGVCNYLFKKF